MAPTKKNVLITGCSADGLGAALAEALHKTNRFRVIATARSPAKMEPLAAQGIETLALDVVSAESIAQSVTAATDLLKADNNNNNSTKDTDAVLHMLILNAGGGYSMPMADTELDRMRELFELNVFSQVAVMQAYLPMLLAAVKRDGPGAATLVLQTSVAGSMAASLQGVYGATKAALSSMADTLRMELKPFDVNVVDLKTGGVGSKFFTNQSSAAKLPPGSMYAVGKAAEVVEQKMDHLLSPSELMDQDVYAAKVVAKLDTRSPSSRLWKGGSATIVWLVRTFLWHTFPDAIMMRMGGMDVVQSERRKVKAGKA